MVPITDSPFPAKHQGAGVLAHSRGFEGFKAWDLVSRPIRHCA